jgi:hypothetical protein
MQKKFFHLLMKKLEKISLECTMVLSPYKAPEAVLDMVQQQMLSIPWPACSPNLNLIETT